MQKTGSPIADAVMDQDRQKDAGISQFWFLVLLIILIIGYAIFNPKPILFGNQVIELYLCEHLSLIHL